MHYGLTSSTTAIHLRTRQLQVISPDALQPQGTVYHSIAIVINPCHDRVDVGEHADLDRTDGVEEALMYLATEMINALLNLQENSQF